MATVTQRNYIKFMAWIIPVVVMVLGCVAAALNTNARRGFGHVAFADGVVKHFVRVPSIGISLVPSPHGFAIGRPVVATFVFVAILMALLLSGFAVIGNLFADFRTISVFPVFVARAFLASTVSPIVCALVLLEFIGRFSFAANVASFGFHKNASCQLGVSACV